jgi:hypothetical protein
VSAGTYSTPFLFYYNAYCFFFFLLGGDRDFDGNVLGDCDVPFNVFGDCDVAF